MRPKSLVEFMRQHAQPASDPSTAN
jgi:hypothetical protein